jgi:hypothetical protein
MCDNLGRRGPTEFEFVAREGGGEFGPFGVDKEKRDWMKIGLSARERLRICTPRHGSSLGVTPQSV